MIAVDTSSLIAFLAGAEGADIDLIHQAVAEDRLRLPPPVLSELLSTQAQAAQMDYLLQVVPLLEVAPDYWARAGLTRRMLLAAGRKARLADVLIAQACLDADVALITRDKDFAAIATFCGLKLAL